MKRWQIIVIIIAVIIVASACGVWYFTTLQPQRPIKRVLRVAFAWPTYADPAVGSDYSSSTTFTAVYDPLVYPAPGGKVKPWVAESWEKSPDGLVWTFKIRKGIKFHTGRELTAEDVYFSMLRMLTIGEGYSYLFAPYVDIDKSKVLDKYTVQFVLKKPFGPFLSSLIRLYIVDKEEVMAHIKKPGPYGEYGDFGRNWLLTHDAGSGPYKIVDVKLEEYVLMERFKDYWAPMPKEAPDTIKFFALTETPTTITLMRKRELEISSQWLTEEGYETLSGIKGISIAKIPGGDIFYFMLHTKKPPTDDVHIRKALAYAFDYETVVKEIFPGNSLATSFVPSYIFGYVNLSDFMPRYDPEKAMEELKKSKYYPDIIKHPEKYPIEVHWCAEVPTEEKAALLFKKNIEENLGLYVKVIKTPWAKMVEEMSRMETSPHIETIFVAIHYPEAGSLLESRYHSKSAKTWEQNEWLLDPKLDAMIEDAISTIDPQERAKKYAEIQRYLVEICPSLVLFEHFSKFAYQSYYVDWPQGRGENITGIMGYDIDPRQIRVYPEKKGELMEALNPLYSTLTIPLALFYILAVPSNERS